MKIAFTGTHSTGKTTLVQELSKYKITPVTDIVRTVPKELRQTPAGQYAVLGNYMSTLCQTKPHWACDRSIIDICAYSLLSSSWSNDEVDAVINLTWDTPAWPDYIFYIPPEIPLASDTERPDSFDRRVVDELIKCILSGHNIKHFTLRGTVEDRMKKIMDTIL